MRVSVLSRSMRQNSVSTTTTTAKDQDNGLASSVLCGVLYEVITGLNVPLAQRRTMTSQRPITMTMGQTRPLTTLDCCLGPRYGFFCSFVLSGRYYHQDDECGPLGLNNAQPTPKCFGPQVFFCWHYHHRDLPECPPNAKMGPNDAGPLFGPQVWFFFIFSTPPPLPFQFQNGLKRHPMSFGPYVSFFFFFSSFWYHKEDKLHYLISLFILYVLSLYYIIS